MKNNVIMISGKARNGKTEFAQYAKKYLESKGQRVCIIAFADLLKVWARKYFEWDGTKDGNQRALLQKVGDMFRQYNSSFWAEKVAEFILATAAADQWDVYLIDDWRYQNELGTMVAYLATLFKVWAIRVNRVGFENDLSQEQRAHSSECDLDNYQGFNYVITNGGSLDNFHTCIEYVIDNIFREDI